MMYGFVCLLTIISANYHVEARHRISQRTRISFRRIPLVRCSKHWSVSHFKQQYDPKKYWTTVQRNPFSQRTPPSPGIEWTTVLGGLTKIKPTGVCRAMQQIGDE